MRVTAGLYKGRQLKNIQYDHLRPTADVVKQALFNKLGDLVQDARVLDLFCGTGALGIEAISRGASEVIFVDSDYRSVTLTKENLKNLDINAKVIKAPFDKALTTLKEQKFDIIILDPPYQKGYYNPALDLIEKYNTLNDNGIIVCEHERKIKLDIKNFQLIDEKIYGIKQLSYYIKQKA